MAAFDFDLGSANNNGVTSGVVFTLTTSHLASANSRVVVLVSYFASASAQQTTGLTIGGTAATRDLRAVNSNGTEVFEVWSLPLAGGLASASSIVATFGGTAPTGVGGILMNAASILGVDMTNGAGVAGTSTAGTLGAGANGTGTSWTSTAATSAGAIALGGVGFENNATNVPDTLSSGTLITSSDQWNTGAGQGACCGYNVGGATIAGAASNPGSPTTVTGGVVAYIGLAATSLRRAFLPLMAPQGMLAG